MPNHRASEPSMLPLVRLFGARSPWTVGIGTTLLLGAIGSLAILVGASQGVSEARLDASTAQLWVNSTATGYVLGLLIFETRRLCADFVSIRPRLLDPGALDLPDLFMRNHHPRSLAAVTIFGAAFGTYFNYSTNGLLHQLVHGHALAWEYAWGPLVLLALWTVVFHVLWILFDNARLLARIARQHVRVDLARLAVFDLFANTGIRHLLLIIVGLTVIPVQSIMTGSLNPIDFVPALAVVLPVGMLLLVLPIYGAHQAIAAQIARELRKIDGLLEAAAPLSDRHLLLALYRQQLAETPAWPLSLRALARIALYLVIPPLAWIAAALVESLVNEAL